MSLFSVFVCLFCCCSNNRIKEENVSSLLNKDVDWLRGKQIHSLDSVIGKIRKCKIVYVFNYYDCETCIERGFETVNYIDDKIGKEYVTVIVSMFCEITSTQRRNSYKGFIYKDEKDLIRKELKYMPTPVILIIDDECRVKDAYIYDLSQDEKCLKDFVQKCLSIND